MTTLHSNDCTSSHAPIHQIRYYLLPEVAREAAVVTELAPILAVMVFGFLPTVELVEAVPIAVGVALAAPEEIVAVTVPTVVVPIVAAASSGSLEASVVVERQ